MSRAAVALFALLMLSYASVQSIVMRAGAASPDPMSAICSTMPMHGMAGMASAASTSRQTHRAAHGNHQKAVCLYCAAAAHTPFVTYAEPLIIPVTVAFVAFHLLVNHGPRGPPSRAPKARGPPRNLTTA